MIYHYHFAQYNVAGIWTDGDNDATEREPRGVRIVVEMRSSVQYTNSSNKINNTQTWEIAN